MRRTICIALAGLCVVGLAACDHRAEKNRTSDAAEKSGDEAFQANFEDGKASIDTPVFQASVKLPDLKLGSDDFDMDGIKLYPGSKIRSVNVKASEPGKTRHAHVTVVFDAPAAPPKVRHWFIDQFKRKGRDVRTAHNLIAGTSEDGDPFNVELAAASAGTTGTVRIDDND